MRSAGSLGKKAHGARTRTASDWQDDKAGLDFLQEGLEADAEVDAAFTGERRQFQEGDIGKLPVRLHCLRASSMTDLALPDSLAGSVASQSTTCVSSKIT
jgi:hypothetical protein